MNILDRFILWADGPDPKPVYIDGYKQAPISEQLAVVSGIVIGLIISYFI